MGRGWGGVCVCCVADKGSGILSEFFASHYYHPTVSPSRALQSLNMYHICTILQFKFNLLLLSFIHFKIQCFAGLNYSPAVNWNNVCTDAMCVGVWVVLLSIWEYMCRSDCVCVCLHIVQLLVAYMCVCGVISIIDLAVMWFLVHLLCLLVCVL